MYVLQTHKSVLKKNIFTKLSISCVYMYYLTLYGVKTGKQYDDPFKYGGQITNCLDHFLENLLS